MKIENKSIFAKRLCMTLGGVIACAFSVGMFNLSAFGVDPFQCFAQGIHIPFAEHLTYGTFYAGLSILLLVVDLFLDKHYIGLATFINMFGTGYIVDASFKLLQIIFPAPGLVLRIVMLILAVVIMCVGSALYYTGDLGVSVYDAIPLSLADKKIQIAGKIMPFKFIRVFFDLVCVIIGTLFGKLPGVGTIITAFFMGPLIDWLNIHMAEPLLYGKPKSQLS